MHDWTDNTPDVALKIYIDISVSIYSAVCNHILKTFAATHNTHTHYYFYGATDLCLHLLYCIVSGSHSVPVFLHHESDRCVRLRGFGSHCTFTSLQAIIVLCESLKQKNKPGTIKNNIKNMYAG